MECCCKKECHGKINLKKRFDIWSKVSVGGEIVIGGGCVRRRRRKEEKGKREQPKKSRVYPVMAHLWSFGSTGS